MTAVHDKAPASAVTPTGASDPQQPSTETTNAPVIFIAGQPERKAVVILGNRFESGARVGLLLAYTALSRPAAEAVLALADEFPDFVAWMPVVDR